MYAAYNANMKLLISTINSSNLRRCKVTPLLVKFRITYKAFQRLKLYIVGKKNLYMKNMTIPCILFHLLHQNVIPQSINQSLYCHLDLVINDHLKSFGHGICKRSKIGGVQIYPELFSFLLQFNSVAWTGLLKLVF